MSGNASVAITESGCTTTFQSLFRRRHTRSPPHSQTEGGGPFKSGRDRGSRRRCTRDGRFPVRHSTLNDPSGGSRGKTADSVRPRRPMHEVCRTGRDSNANGLRHRQPGSEDHVYRRGTGADEDRQGEPFVGAAGQLLNRILEACQLQRADIYICNILRCRPPGNRTPAPDEAASCREYLDGQIEIVDPDYIVCLGERRGQEPVGERRIDRQTSRPFLHSRARQGRLHLPPRVPLAQSGCQKRRLGRHEIPHAGTGRRTLKQPLDMVPRRGYYAPASPPA